MHILHMTPTYKPAYIYGGVTVSISLLCETLASAGHDVTVLTATSNGNDDLPAYTKKPKWVDGVKTYYFPRWIKGAKQLSPQLLWWLWQNVKKYEVVHLHSWWNLDTLCAMAICRIKGIKPVFSPRGMLSDYSTTSLTRRSFNTYIGKFLFKNSHLHATATQELEECLTIKPDWQYTILPNLLNLKTYKNGKKSVLAFANSGEQTDEFLREHILSDMTFKILFFSRIHPKKGLENLFEALSKVDFEWTLTIAGDGEEAYIQSLKNIGENLGISSNIKWVGWVKPEKKHQTLKEADLMVLPSFSENFANVVIESLAVGTPVLISNKTGLSDYVFDKKLGWICATTVADIHQKLQHAYSNFEYRLDIEQRAVACIEKDFTPSVLVKQYENMYRTL